MGRGKAAAQACHASVMSCVKSMKKNKKSFQKWLGEGQKKVVLKVSSKKELLELFESAKKKTAASLVKDAGLTQLPLGECSAVGIGPDKDEVVDGLVSSLKLF
jgi:PTH2 family peptidyl-tRNA hydrolase